MRCAAAAKMMALDQTGETPALAGPDNMNQFVHIEDIDHHLISGIGSFFSLNCNFACEPRRCDIRFFEVTGHRLVDALRLDKLDESQLNGVVSILLRRL